MPIPLLKLSHHSDNRSLQEPSLTSQCIVLNEAACLGLALGQVDGTNSTLSYVLVDAMPIVLYFLSTRRRAIKLISWCQQPDLT